MKQINEHDNDKKFATRSIEKFKDTSSSTIQVPLHASFKPMIRKWNIVPRIIHLSTYSPP